MRRWWGVRHVRAASLGVRLLYMTWWLKRRSLYTVEYWRLEYSVVRAVWRGML